MKQDAIAALCFALAFLVLVISWRMIRQELERTPIKRNHETA